MDVTSASQLSAMAEATSFQNAAGVAVLKTAMDTQSAMATQLLQSMPAAPRAEGKGTLVDVSV